MAKSENPIDVYRRKQRKKEVKKNKTARIKARDAKVAATGSLDEVKSEISLLERKRDRNDEKTGLDAIETKKLERLQKELRIVSLETEKRRALAEEARIENEKELLAQQKTVAGVQKLNESKYSLVERYASVYYDEMMNPFGAPAPGQPKLYYADGEGKSKTMDSRRAVVPVKWRKKFEAEGGGGGGNKDVMNIAQEGGVGDGDVARVKKRRWDDRGDGTSNIDQQQMMMPPPVNAMAPPPPPPPQQIPPPPPAFPPPPSHLQHYMPPPPPPQMFQPPPPPPPQMPHHHHRVVNNNFPPPPPVPPPPPPLPLKDKFQPPALPAPSKSVVRAAKRGKKKGDAMADIWASQEEMEYESTLGGDLEGTAEPPVEPYMPKWKRNKQKNHQKKKDDTLNVNDPCCPSADGYGEYRNKEQIERQSQEASMRKQEQHEHVAQHLAKSTNSISMATYSMQQPIWYYRDNTSGALQGPFSGEQMMGWRAFFPMTTPVRFGHDDNNGESVALSEVDFANPPLPPAPVPLPPPPPPPPKPLRAGEAEVEVASYPVVLDYADDVADDSAEDRLKAKPEVEATMPSLTAEDPTISEAEIAEPLQTDDDGGPEVEACLPPPSDDEGYEEDDRGDRDEDVDAENDGPEVDVCLPPPSDDEVDHENDADGAEVEMCLPPPSDDEEEQGADVPYPGVGEYPLPDEDAVPYPDDVEYPEYDYPDTGDAYGDASEMAAVAPYPSTDDVVFGVTNDAVEDKQVGGMEVMQAMPPVEEKKKKYDGDKDVVGFMPSHLRVKRQVAKPPKKKPAAAKQSLSSALDAVPLKDGGAKEQEKYSVADDYNKFMDEISELK